MMAVRRAVGAALVVWGACVAQALTMDEAFPHLDDWLEETGEFCPVLDGDNIADLLWKEHPVGAMGAIVLVGSDPETLTACMDMRRSGSMVGMANVVQIDSEEEAVALGLPGRPPQAEGSDEPTDSVTGMVVPWVRNIDERKARVNWIDGGRALARGLRESVPRLPGLVVDVASFQGFVMDAYSHGKAPVAYLTGGPKASATISALLQNLMDTETVAVRVFVNMSEAVEFNSMMKIDHLPALLLFAPGEVDVNTGHMPLSTIEFPREQKITYVKGLLWTKTAMAAYGEIISRQQVHEEQTAPSPRYGDSALYELTEDSQDDVLQTKATILLLGLLEGDAEAQAKQRRILEAVGNDVLLEKRSVRFSWVDAECYPEIGAALHVVQYPQVVAFNNAKNTYAVLPNAFEQSKIVSWTSKLLKGALAMRDRPDNAVVKVDGRDCAAILAEKQASVHAALDAEGDMDDILAEMAAERAAKEEREKIEEEEAAEAAAKAKTKKSKKKKSKKKKSKSKKKAAAKDEL